MGDSSHQSSVHGNLNPQNSNDVHETLAKKAKDIYELKDKLDRLLQLQEDKAHRNRSRYGEGSHKQEHSSYKPFPKPR